MQSGGWIKGVRFLALAVGLTATFCGMQQGVPLRNDKVPAFHTHTQTETTTAQESEVETVPRVRAALGKLPLYFIENRGQVDARVAYYVQGQNTTLYFTPEGTTFVLTSQEKHSE